MDYRYSIQPANNNDLLYSYKELIINSHPTQQEILHRHVLELLKYQGYIYFLDDMKQWSIPTFPIHAWDLEQHGLIAGNNFPRFLRRLKEQWKLNQFKMTKEELIEYGFQSGLFYT